MSDTPRDPTSPAATDATASPAAPAAKTPFLTPTVKGVGGNFVCPGLGQFALRRWFSGVIYILLFFGSMAAFGVTMVMGLWKYSQVQADMLSPASSNHRQLLIYCAIAAAVCVGTWLISMLHGYLISRTRAAPAEPEPT